MRAVLKPAAARCPPPPSSRAIADTSTAGSAVRSETRYMPSGPASLTRAAARMPRTPAHHLDDALGVAAAGGVEVVAREHGREHAAAGQRTGALERAAHEQQAVERLLLVEMARHRGGIDAGLDHGRRDPVRARAGVAVPEAAGVGDHPDVERLGDLPGDRPAGLLEDVPDDLRGAGGERLDQVEVAEAGVVLVVVDVDHHPRALMDRGVPHPQLAGAVDRHQHPLPQIGGQVLHDHLVVAHQEREVARDRGVVGVRHHHVVPGGAQGPGEPEHRADRVAVGVVVRGHHEPLAGAGEDLGDLGRGRVASRTVGHACSSVMSVASSSSGGAGGVPAVTSSMNRVRATASCWVLS